MARDYLVGLVRQPSADALRPYMGRCVAVLDGEVVADGGTLNDLLIYLRKHKLVVDSVFRVPADPEEDSGIYD